MECSRIFAECEGVWDESGCWQAMPSWFGYQRLHENVILFRSSLATARESFSLFSISTVTYTLPGVCSRRNWDREQRKDFPRYPSCHPHGCHSPRREFLSWSKSLLCFSVLHAVPDSRDKDLGEVWETCRRSGDCITQAAILGYLGRCFPLVRLRQTCMSRSFLRCSWDEDDARVHPNELRDWNLRGNASIKESYVDSVTTRGYKDKNPPQGMRMHWKKSLSDWFCKMMVSRESQSEQFCLYQTYKLYTSHLEMKGLLS